MTTRFTLISTADFTEDVLKAIAKAERRVYVMSTILNEDSSTAELFQSIQNAAKRGLDVHIAGDAYTFTEIGGHFKFNTQFSKRIRSVTGLKRAFEKAGAKFIWLGSDTSTLLSGRTHTKWIIADDTVYTFGGINLYSVGLENTDYMFKITNQELADSLVSEHHRIVRAVKNRHAYRSHMFGDDTHRVLVDGGFVGDSVIYRHACRLIEQATDVTFVSQYCPNGRLGRLLKKANARVYFNPWNQANSLNALYIRITSRLSGNKTDYTRKAYIHSKFIICTMPDGSKIALTGSHNYAQGGVWLGTREIALETRDPHVIKQLERFVDDYIA